MSRLHSTLTALLALSLGPAASAQGLGPADRVPGLSGVAIDLDVSGDRWAVVFEDGSVLVNRPDGLNTRLRAPRQSLSDTDDAVLRLEGLLGDVADIEDQDEDAPFDPDADEEVEEVEEPEDPTEDLEEFLQGETSVADGPIGPGGGIVRWGVGDRIAVSRSDGIWLSEDAGRRWQRLSRDDARDLADTGTSWVALLAGGDVLIDGDRERVSLGPMTLEVVDLSASDGTIWAATDLGLWRHDRTGWRPAGDDLSSLTQVVADPGWEGGLWVTGDNGIQRTDDGGASWRALEGAPSRGFLSWGGPAPGGALLVNGDGLWLHRDGGWLRDPRRVDKAIATGAGVFALAEGYVLAPAAGATDASELPPWISLSNLMYTTLSRPELTKSIQASRIAQTLMPMVTVEGSTSPEKSTDYLPFSTAKTGGDKRLMVRMTWTPAGRSGAGEAFDNAVEEISLRTGFDDIGVSDRGLMGAMGGRVGRDASKQRSALAEVVGQLYWSRNELLFEKAALPPQGLLDQVSWQLRLEEVEARLDALSGGAVSAWSHNPNSID